MKKYIQNLKRVSKNARKRVIAQTCILFLEYLILYPLFLLLFLIFLVFLSLVFVILRFNKDVFLDNTMLDDFIHILSIKALYDILFNHYYLRYTCKKCKEKRSYSVNIKSNEIERTNIWDFYNPKEKICYTCLRDRERQEMFRHGTCHSEALAEESKILDISDRDVSPKGST